MAEFKVHVISNTHWDREWLYSFQETRMQLIEVIEKILELLEAEANYNFFTFDGQTVALEDYLDIKPENRRRIANLVKSGKLLIGPWYVLPEEMIVNGESIVRNILLGHQVGNSLGKVTKFGYTASSAAQCSQMPQIMQGFDIDGMFFYRGIRPEVVAAEFRWQSPDGSEILATRLSAYPRYNFFFLVFRPIVYGLGWDDRVYFWRQGGMPMRLCSAGEEYEHYFQLAPREDFSAERVTECIQKLVAFQRQHETTTVLAGMQGMDSTMPHPAEKRIISEANRKLSHKALLHSNMVDYFKQMRKRLENPPLLKGELKYSQTQVFSARTYIKQLNAQAETALIYFAEPWSAISWLAGGKEYPAQLLNLAWRYLLRNQAHDTIHGCGVDRIHLDAEYRFAQVQELSQSLTRRAFSHLLKKIHLPKVDTETIYIVVFNPATFSRNEIIKLVLEIPQEWQSTDFNIIQANDNKVADSQVIRAENGESIVRHLQDVTMAFLNRRCHIRLNVQAIPPFGYKVFRVVKGDGIKKEKQPQISTSLNVVENESLKVRIKANGTITVKDKTSGRVFKNLNYFEDIGEIGTAWDFKPPEGDKPRFTLKENPVIELAENGPLYAAYRIKFQWHLPAEFNAEKKRRSDKSLPLEIIVEVGLAKGERRLEFTTFINNNIRDHRLRIIFPTYLTAAQVSFAGSPYDIVARPIEQVEIRPGVLFPPFPTHPFTDLVFLQNRESGIAFFSDEFSEYEVSADASRTLAVTVIRAFEMKLPTVTNRWETRPDQLGSQCLRPHTFRYALYFYNPQTHHPGNLMRECQRYILQLRAVQCGACEPSLGKPSFPRQFSFLKIKPAELVFLGALKKAEDSNNLIIRLYNPTQRKTTAELQCYRPLAAAWLTNLEEKNLQPLIPKVNKLRFNFPAKKILTIKLKIK